MIVLNSPWNISTSFSVGLGKLDDGRLECQAELSSPHTEKNLTFSLGDIQVIIFFLSEIGTYAASRLWLLRSTQLSPPFSACSQLPFSLLQPFRTWDQGGGEKRNWYLPSVDDCHTCVGHVSSPLMTALWEALSSPSLRLVIKELAQSTWLESDGTRTQTEVSLTLVSFMWYHIAFCELEAMQFISLFSFKPHHIKSLTGK